MKRLDPRTLSMLAHGLAAAAALAAGSAAFGIGARVGGFALGLAMGLNAAVCGALLVVSAVDAGQRVLGGCAGCAQAPESPAGVPRAGRA